MKDQKLMTLKQIADQIGVNYKTIHHYRDVFEEYMKIQFAGRRVKYLPENADLFCKILELKDEGHSNEDIREILKVSNSESPKVDLSDDLDDLPAEGIDKDTPEQAGADEDNPVCPDSDKDELADSGADVAAQIQAGMDQARKASLKEAEVLIGSLLVEQAGQLEGILQKMATQSNIAITALCEASEDIHKSILALDARLSRMEKGLDMDEAVPLELYQVKAENYQVDLPEISPPVFQDPDQDPNQDPEDDLAPVKGSITDGIPDRETVVEWIISRRDEDLQANSYSALAATLNEAEIPTLSGRANWSRSTVRIDNQVFMDGNVQVAGGPDNFPGDVFVRFGRGDISARMVMCQYDGCCVGQQSRLQDISWEHVGTGQAAGGHDVHADDPVFDIQQQDTELFPVRLASFFNQLGHQSVSLGRMAQLCFLKPDVRVPDQVDAVDRYKILGFQF